MSGDNNRSETLGSNKDIKEQLSLGIFFFFFLSHIFTPDKINRIKYRICHNLGHRVFLSGHVSVELYKTNLSVWQCWQLQFERKPCAVFVFETFFYSLNLTKLSKKFNFNNARAVAQYTRYTYSQWQCRRTNFLR